MKIIFTVILILVSCWGVEAKGWKGIVPLHSARADVERLLGAPTGECKCLYDTGSETVRVEYAKAPCVGYPSGWNVSADKVLTLHIRPNQPAKFTDLQLRGSKFYKAADDTFTRYYSSRVDGVQYTVSWDGMVQAVTYIPSSNNSALRCPCFPLLDESIQRSKSFDEFQLGTVDDALARLDPYIIALLNEKRWTGYMVLYNGRDLGPKQMSAFKTAITRHVLRRRAVPPQRIKLIDGGYRVKPEIELYLLTAELSPPEPRATLTPCPPSAELSASVVPLSDIHLASIGPIAPKGRVQDAGDNNLPVVTSLTRHGKEAIPYLISKLDDETKIDGHVMDYWYEVRVADVALIILTDFFTDSSLQNTTVPGVGWDEFLERAGNRDLTAEQVLRNYISKHGRQAIKDRWQALWLEYRDRLFWDENERCFKIRRV